MSPRKMIAIGVREVAEIIDASSRRFARSPSLDREKRQRELERGNLHFDDLDDKLFALEKKIDLDKKLMDYIRKNRTKFYFSGSVKK